VSHRVLALATAGAGGDFQPLVAAEFALQRRGHESFDTVVCTLPLCTIPADRVAVAEVRRVLRPSGRFLLLEHVRSPLLPVRLGQRLPEPLAVRFEADHLLREPLQHLRAEGFGVEALRRSKLGVVERVAARKPSIPE
jgi:SAM-dependent methyltransferase